MEFTGEFFVPDEKFKDLSADRELAIEHLQRYKSILYLVDNKEVLDIASGEGYGSAMLAGKAARVTGVDINAELVAYASKKYKKDNLVFKEGNVTAIPLDTASVDVVISFETLEHVGEKDQVKFIQEAERVLRKDGVLIISTPNKENYSDRFNFTNTFHAHELDEASFVSLLQLTFPQVEVFNQGQEIVSILFNKKRYEEERPLQVLPVVSEHYCLQGKYLLAVCSKSEKKEMPDISSIVVEGNKSFFDLTERIIELQDHVEELGAWGRKLNAEQHPILEKINSLQSKISDLNKEIQEQKNTILRIESQKNGFEQRLQHIYDSEGWRLLSVYYRLKEKMLPESSHRYKLLKKWFQLLKKDQKKKYYKSLTTETIDPNIVKDYRLTPVLDADIEFPVIFPVFDEVEVSITMPAFNNWEFTRNCLLSIYKHNDGIPFEVIVGDNVSDDETQRLPEYFHNVNYIRNKENLGYIKNVNNAASKARGKYILTLNNDTTVTEGWLVNLVKIMEADPKVGLVGSKLVFPDGILQEAGGIIWRDGSGWNYGRGSDPDMPEYNYVKEVDYISGASNLVRRELWEKLNGLDLRYAPAYFDDSDLAFGIRSLGYKVMYQPLSVVIHYEGLTHGTNTSSGTKQYQLLNLEKFKQKWKEELMTNHFPNGENVFSARDKSKNKKTILVIDHYVPQFDKDAGSRTVFQYLKLFGSLDYNVKFIGDNFFRHEPYTTVLQQMGIEVLYGPWYANHWQEWLKTNQDKFDFILLNRPHISVKYIDFIKTNTNARILYYGHDLHFLRKEKEYELEKDKNILAQVAKWKEIELYLFSKSDIILTPSTEEQKIIKSLNSVFNVQLMRPYIYKTISEPVINFQQRKDIFFVGGFGHLPNVDGVLWFVKEVWPLIKRKIPGVKFIIAGSNPPQEIKALDNSDIIIKGYVGDDELEKLYATCKMAVIPLRYGAGVKGKTVEAMRYGIPLVTTGFGVEGLPGDFSFLKVADESQSFASLVIDMYDDEFVLADISTKSIQYIKDNFTEEIATEIIRKAMATV